MQHPQPRRGNYSRRPISARRNQRDRIRAYQNTSDIHQVSEHSTTTPRDGQGHVRRPLHSGEYRSGGYRKIIRGGYNKDRHGYTAHRHYSQGSTTERPSERNIHNEGNQSHTGMRPSRIKPMRGREKSRYAGVSMSARTQQYNQTAHIADPSEGTVRIIPLGGVEEIGRNMTVVEYGNDIIIIDAGFQFKEDETPGIDYILPNITYLEERREKIRALLVTHGHLDHIGGIPYIMDRLGNPPLYTRRLTAIMVQKRQAEFPQLPALDIREVEKDSVLTLGSLKVRFFAVTHTIPDSMGIAIETPKGLIVTPGDYKLDHVDGTPSETEEREYNVFKNENVLFMMADSTNIENPGFSTPEWLVHENLDKIIKDIKSRLIIGTFSSQLQRIMGIIKIAEKYDRKIIVEGRSMKTNIDIAIQSGMLETKRGVIIPSAEIDHYPANKIIVLATGAQGEEFAALMRMANRAHKVVNVREGDTVLLSSSIVPGNEKAVEKLKDQLARAGARIVHYRTSEVFIHSTGHGNRGELEWLHRKIHPKFFMPIHGNHYRLKLHGELAMTLGMTKDQIVIPDNGSIVEIVDGERIRVREEKAPGSAQMVDGLAVGDIQEVVLRDRQALSEDGMFVIIAMVNTKTGRLKKSPDIISRGFIYLRESQDLLAQTRLIVKKAVEDASMGTMPINFEYVKKNVTEATEAFLFQKTNKTPIVIPVVLGV